MAKGESGLEPTIRLLLCKALSLVKCGLSHEKSRNLCFFFAPPGLSK